MTDIVERLAHASMASVFSGPAYTALVSVLDDASHEIEKLRELLTLAGMYVNPHIDTHADAMALWKRIDEALR